MKKDRPFLYWNAWTTRYTASVDGYINHVWQITDENGVEIKARRTLCGAKINDSGLVELFEDQWTPGCLKCTDILIKRGHMTPERTKPMSEAIDSTNLPPKGTVVHWWHWNGKATTTYVGEYLGQSSRGPYANVKRRDTGKTVRVRTPFLRLGKPENM